MRRSLACNGKDAMPKTLSHRESARTMETAKSRVHVFRGQELAEPILEWLRRSDRPADDPVEHFVRMEATFSEAAPWDRQDMAHDIAQLINDTTTKWDPGRVLGADFVGSSYTVNWKQLNPAPEPLGLLAWRHCLLLKKEQDLLDRIRPCARPGCGEWFFAKFDHQKCHCDKCRVAMLSTDETRKEARKKYMRDLRAKKKVKKFRSQKKGGGKS
jgi:hypothetical protein